MVADPAETGVIIPLLLLIAAMLALELLQVPPVTVEEKLFVLLFKQIFCVPDKVPAVGVAVIVMVRVSDALAHPPVPVTV